MIEDPPGRELDFFEEAPTREAERRPPRPRGGGGPPAPTRRTRPRQRPGLGPMLRLAGLIGFGIVLVVLLTLWVNSCRAEGARDAYRSYLQALQTVASGSAAVGSELNDALTTPGIGAADLQSTLAGLAQQQEQEVVRARELTPPGRLRDQHREAIQALQLRATGLRELHAAFGGIGEARAADAARTLAVPMRLLVASDVVWESGFLGPARAVMEARDIRGIEVPDSKFLANYELSSEQLLSQISQRLVGASGGGRPAPGRHGTALVSVVALPSGEALKTDEDNFVVATSDLAFRATVENQGEHQEVGVEVVLTIDQSPQPITKQGKIQIINAGERKNVAFRNLGQIVQFAQKTTVKVEVKPVPGEQFLDNNTASYGVTFTIVP